MNRATLVIGCVVWMTGVGCSQRDQGLVETAGGHRSLPPLCLPCGDERSLGIATPAQFDEVFTELVEACGESNEANDWRQRVEDAGVDFESEALLIVWDYIGTQGQAALGVEARSPGVLEVALEWDIPSGPARPVATAACFSLAVDKTQVNQVEVNKGGRSVLSMTF